MTPGSRFCTSCGAAVPSNARFCGSCGQPLTAPAQPAEVPAAPLASPAAGARGSRTFLTGCLPLALFLILAVAGGGYFAYDYFRKEELREEIKEAVAQARVLAATDDPNEWKRGAVLLYETDMRCRQELPEEDRAEMRALLDELHARLTGPSVRKETERRLERAKALAAEAFDAAAKP